MMRKALGLVFVAVFATMVSAQTPTGAIGGSVTDDSGAGVANARVQAVNQDTGVQSTVTTSNNGLYSFPNLPVGTYTVTVTVPGFQVDEEGDIEVTDGSVFTLTVTLEGTTEDASAAANQGANPAPVQAPQGTSQPAASAQPAQTNPNTAAQADESTPPGMIDLGAPPLSPDEMNAVMTWTATQVSAITLPYCYRQKYGNGVGEPYTCRDGYERNGLVCYPKCRDGFAGNGPVCWQSCPADFRNDPDHCGKPASYGRGGGYVIWQGDQCNKDNPQGCEQLGALWYPKCRANFHAAGCCVCSPDCPLGMPDIGVSCQKQSYGRGAGEPLADGLCAPGLQKDPTGALCYPTCKDGFHMVGPVCWQNCPSQQPFECGVGCSTDQKECASGTVNMVFAPIMMLANLIPYAGEAGGAAKAAFAAGRTAAKVAAAGEEATKLAEVGAKLGATLGAVKDAVTGPIVQAVGGEANLAKILGVSQIGTKVVSKVDVVATDTNKQIDLYSREYADNFDKLTSPAIAAQIDQRFGPVGAYQVKREWGVRHLILAMHADGYEKQTNEISALSTFDFSGVLGVVSAFMKPTCEGNTVFPTVHPLYDY
ncbi:MAG: carboxypeptidase regulatory-like domain-containing protein [Candidatus Korobacteraceae bacterium]